MLRECRPSGWDCVELKSAQILSESIFPRLIDAHRGTAMEDLLPYYERELGIFRQYSRKFAQRYSKTAGHLLIAGEASEDPHDHRVLA